MVAVGLICTIRLSERLRGSFIVEGIYLLGSAIIVPFICYPCHRIPESIGQGPDMIDGLHEIVSGFAAETIFLLCTWS